MSAMFLTWIMTAMSTSGYLDSYMRHSRFGGLDDDIGLGFWGSRVRVWGLGLGFLRRGRERWKLGGLRRERRRIGESRARFDFTAQHWENGNIADNLSINTKISLKK